MLYAAFAEDFRIILSIQWIEAANQWDIYSEANSLVGGFKKR